MKLVFVFLFSFADSQKDSYFVTSVLYLSKSHQTKEKLGNEKKTILFLLKEKRLVPGKKNNCFFRNLQLKKKSIFAILMVVERND